MPNLSSSQWRLNVHKISGWFLVVLLVALVGGFAARSFAADADVPQVGQQAPTFTLPSQDGSTISLDSFRGKWVVLYFYPKDMTTGCTIEAHNFQRDLAQYEAVKAVIVGVSVDSVNSHQQFCTKEGLDFRLLSDESKSVTKQYGSLAMYQAAKRNTFLIDPKGKIVKVWTGVNPAHHSEEVLAELKEQQQAAH
jgi:thioredoxin-dependent peroxiredoxin